jgi:cob(I)alamin adenosyltransferase
MKIYTKAGDAGETTLVDGSRVRKDHARVGAYGDVDELNAALGVALAEESGEDLGPVLGPVQRDLFAIGAQLADPSARVAERKEKAALPPARIVALERAIDEREAVLPPLTAFVMPGGTKAAAALHVARTVCRRAERSIVALGDADPVDPLILVYLNRLSDLLFVLARHANHLASRAEPKW